MRYRSVAQILVLLTAAVAGAQERRDFHGDPLPPRAVARLGSTRLTQQYVLSVAIAPDASAVASVDPFLGELCVWEAPDWRLRWSTTLRSLGQFSPSN
ncbi:MAG TPA: hypothetical protein VKD72_09760, partial [Gemmataceae bacterium]|nr:hypothetical protein [Gemmataceae bacterium]